MKACGRATFGLLTHTNLFDAMANDSILVPVFACRPDQWLPSE